MAESLYDQLGGEKAIDAAVDIFYKKVLSDERIKHFFDDIDMEKQRRKQKEFLTLAFGGPNKYKARSMAAAHRKLVEEQGLNDMHFDAVVENLGTTLSELNVPKDLIQKSADIANSTRDQVLCRGEFSSKK